MKPFHEQNHYELLDLPPDASPLEIRRAYKNTLELYRDDSIVSYSFFSPEERKHIISCLEEAYLTLINPESRGQYDSRLIEIGILEEGKQHSYNTGIQRILCASLFQRGIIPGLNFRLSLPRGLFGLGLARILHRSALCNSKRTW